MSTQPQHTPAQDLLQCSLKPCPARAFDPNVSLDRAETIIITSKYWANGTLLKYYFFTDDGRASGKAETDLVRDAFQTWKNLGIGISFEETTEIDTAQIRIAFMRGDGAWSYIGRDCLSIPIGQPTMNFGWDLLQDPRTVGVAIHEIGHAIGLPHEHQNPNAGIVWNVAAVMTAFSEPPNSWDEQTIRNNILNKLEKSEIKGSKWDPASIMEYSFAPEMISAPSPFNETGINPSGDKLSDLDMAWTRRFYPPIGEVDLHTLKIGQSEAIQLQHGEQITFKFTPEMSRQYEVRTFGNCDAVLVVFEHDNDGCEYLLGKDDSGKDENAYIKLRLQKDRTYHINIRMLYRNPDSISSVMLW
ncbi:M12 family metallopeptidase [Duganella sp. Dugasp56]|uniref:M12 family metallopeptidase n=1 Tax=Duganella sp. Dugasp56 TaxID=3243046 RepID=UPI0039B0E0CB